MPTDLSEQGPDQDALASLLIEALDGDDPRRAALILRWSFLVLDQEQRHEQPVRENI